MDLIIEDIIDFDRKNLSIVAILSSGYGKSLTLFFILLTFSIIGFITSFLFVADHPTLISSLGCFVFLIASIVAILRNNKIVRKAFSNYSARFNFSLPRTITAANSQTIFGRIQYELFKEYISSNSSQLEKEKIEKLIEMLRSDVDGSKYGYQSKQFLSSIITLILGGMLASYLGLIKDAATFNIIAEKLGVILLIIVILFLGVEELVVKPILTAKTQKYKRLIRILRNYSLQL